MVTYGPTQLSLLDRLTTADAVLLFAGAKLLESTIDEFSESPREIGTFELGVVEVLDGDAGKGVRVRVVRGADKPWPLPEDGEAVALLQRDPPGPDWVLVHDGAYPLRRDGFEFDESIEPGSRRPSRRRVSLDELKKLIRERRRQARKAEVALSEREGRLLNKIPRLPSEMPESPELAGWLDPSHTQAARSGKPGGTRSRPRPKRTGRGGGDKSVKD